MSTEAQTAGRASPGEGPPEYRYGAVLMLMVLATIFVIVAPSAAWSRAAALVIESAALLVAVATARAPRAVRRRRVEVGSLLAVVAVFGVALSVVPPDLDFALSGLIAGAIPVAIVGGLLGLVRERGVTAQVVAGALAVYLTVGTDVRVGDRLRRPSSAAPRTSRRARAAPRATTSTTASRF